MLKFLKFSFLAIILLNSFIPASAQTQTAKDYFEQGLRLAKEQKLEDALAAFRKSAGLDAKQATTQANIGLVLIQLRREAESVAPFREAVRLAPTEAGFRIGLCQSLSMTKSHAEAIAQCEEAVRLGGNAPEPHGALVTALREAKRRDDALRVATAALAKFAENEMLLRFAAETNSETGNYARATEIYETLARLKPNSVHYQIMLAENYLRLERDSEAIAAANKAIALEKHPMAYFFLGRVYFELGQNEEAAAAFQQSAALDAKLAEAFYYLGLSQQRRGKSDEAITALRQAAALQPENFDFNKELGSALTTATKYEEAAAPLRKALALKPTDFETKVGLGVLMFELMQFDESLRLLGEADRMKPGNQIVNMFLNVARSRQQGIAQIDEMKRYAKENPGDLNVRMNLMQLLVYSRRIPEAKLVIEEVLQMNPKDARVYNTIGILYATTGEINRAIEVQKKSLEIEINPTAYANLASIYGRSGQIKEASEYYEKFFALRPDAPNIMKGYADLLRDHGKRREALEMYKRSLVMLPTNSPALFNAGLLSAKLNDLNAARQYLETLKAVDAQTAKTLERYLKLRR